MTSTPDGATSDLDTVRRRLNVVTRETRFSPVRDILGHPSRPSTPKELNYVNPSRSRATIRQHPGRLVEAGQVSSRTSNSPGAAGRMVCRTRFTGSARRAVDPSRSTDCCAPRRPSERSTTVSRNPPRSDATSSCRVPTGEWFDGPLPIPLLTPRLSLFGRRRPYQYREIYSRKRGYLAVCWGTGGYASVLRLYFWRVLPEI